MLLIFFQNHLRDVRFKQAFKKLRKSIPEALKKDLTESKNMKIRDRIIEAKYF